MKKMVVVFFVCFVTIALHCLKFEAHVALKTTSRIQKIDRSHSLCKTQRVKHCCKNSMVFYYFEVHSQNLIFGAFFCKMLVHHIICP